MPELIRGALCDSASIEMAEASVLISAVTPHRRKDSRALSEVFLSFKSANNLKNQRSHADEEGGGGGKWPGKNA